MKIYLYVKTHQVTGLKYLGQTTASNPHLYPGSGLYWKRHLEKYGNNFSTEIIQECQTEEELREFGIYYSNLWNVVESKEWANLKEEAGQGGRGYKHRVECRHCMSATRKAKMSSGEILPWNKGKIMSSEFKSNLSKYRSGRKASEETKAKMSQSARKRKPNITSYKWTDEHRRNYSKSRVGRKKTYRDDGSWYYSKPNDL